MPTNDRGPQIRLSCNVTTVGIDIKERKARHAFEEHI
jgi:hypothetical protein